MANILISDDHPLTLMGTKTYVESLGHNIVELCSNRITAYNMILQRKPDIAILDINMPGMNGLEVLEKLQSSQPKTKVVLLTMHNEISIFNRAKALNVKGYVLKEFSTDVLEDCINAVLNNETWFNPELSRQMNMNTDPENESLLDKLTFAEKKNSATHRTPTYQQGDCPNVVYLGKNGGESPFQHHEKAGTACGEKRLAGLGADQYA